MAFVRQVVVEQSASAATGRSTLSAERNFLYGRYYYEAFWHSVGESIYEFHEAGVYHADMNAYNLQIDKSGSLWMLDFDKGALRPRGPWQQATLDRLHRSLYKIVGLDPRLNFRAANWEQLLEGYFSASISE